MRAEGQVVGVVVRSHEPKCGWPLLAQSGHRSIFALRIVRLPKASSSWRNGSVPDSGNKLAQIATRPGHWPHDRSGAYQQTRLMTAFERLGNRRIIHETALSHVT